MKPVEEWMERGLVHIASVRPAKGADPTPGDRKSRIDIGGTKWDVWAHGSGFLIDAEKGLIFTCDHVRTLALKDNISPFGKAWNPSHRLVCCLYIGGETDWKNAWEVEVLAHTNDWNQKNRTDCTSVIEASGCKPYESPGATNLEDDYADAAVLRVTKKLLTEEAAKSKSFSSECFTLNYNSEDFVYGQQFYSLGYPLSGGLTPTP